MEHGTLPAAKLCETVKMYLVGLDQNEDVVHPNGQHQERDDFNHNEGERDPSVAEDAQRARHRAQHDEDTRDAEGDFRIYLRNATKTVVRLFSILSITKRFSFLPLYTSTANLSLREDMKNHLDFP